MPRDEAAAGAAQRPLYLHEYRPVTKVKTAAHDLRRPRFDAIDAHGHFADLYCPLYAGGQSWQRPDIGALVDFFRGMGIRRMVNLDGFWDGFLGLSMEHVFDTLRPWADFFITFVSVDTREAGKPGFDAKVRAHLNKARDLGAKGVKLFKHLSLMVEKEPYVFVPGRGLLPDDARLAIVWDTAAELGLPVLIHIADPPAFFDPVDAQNERYLELRAHPDWAYHGSGTYTFEELMRAQCNLLARHPRTTFIIPHVGSHAENLAFVTDCMRRHPNMIVDIAARVGELGRQPYTARAFFERFADRILFGTDAFSHDMHWRYPPYFRFLETLDEGIANGHTIGIGLDDATLRKVYYENARRVLGL